MLSASAGFTTAHELDYKTPVYLIHFDGESIDYCNREILSPDNEIKLYLESISGMQRTVEPEEGTGTIGGLTIRMLDYQGAITTLLSTDAVFFHRKKVTVKAGYLNITEAEMLTIFTGWITAIKLSGDGMVYEMSVTDPQKWMQRKIFRGAETSTVSISGNPLNLLLAVLLSTGNGTNGDHDRYIEENGLGIDADYIDVAGIEDVRDNYFPGTSNKMTFTIKSRIKAKDWIENQILKPLNLYPAVDGQGRYGIKPSKPPIEAIETVQSFNEDNTIGIPTWDMNLVGLLNEIEFHYDFDSDDDSFKTETYFVDSDSLSPRGPGAKVLKVESKGFRTEDNALAIITRRKNSVFTRYATPPIKISANCFFTQLLSEPGDVVPFTHRLLPDVESGVRGLSLERMEIIRISVDWKRGICRVEFLQTGFDQGTYQVITPTMTIADHLGSELLTNGSDWTGATGATPPTGWTIAVPGLFEITAGGKIGNCLSMAVNAAPNANPRIYQDTMVVIGKKYRVLIWFKHGDGIRGEVIVGSTTNGTDYANWSALTDAAWTKYSVDVTATTTKISIRLRTISSTAGQYELFDEASVKEILLPDPTTTSFNVSTDDAAKYDALTLPEVQLLNKNMRQLVAAATLLTVDTATGACTSDDFGVTPTAGNIVSFADYDNATTEQKLWGYIAASDNTLGTDDDAAHLILP